MIDHVNLPVSDIKQAKNFYQAVLETFEIGPIFEDSEVVGFGKGYWQFGIEQIDTAGIILHLPKLHLAFKAKTVQEVQAFYSAAMKAGAACNGPPGPRPIYGPSYYAAFVHDPDGHNIEVVYRGDT